MVDFFTPLNVGPLVLPNRLVMAPLTRLRAKMPGAIPWELNAEYYAQRASAGLIVSEATPIAPQGQGYYGAPGIFTDEQEAGWKIVVDRIHQAGGRIFLQLWHVGAISHPDLQPDGGAPVAPSAFNPGGRAPTEIGLQDRVTARALETEEIPGIIADYVQATQRARRAGFDGVEVHGANGYLIEQFLLSGTNQRTDIYGGPVENRVRFLREVVTAVCEAWEPGRVGLRLSPASEGGAYQDPDRCGLYQAALLSLRNLPLAYVHFVEPRLEAEDGAAVKIELAAMTFRPFLPPGSVLISAGGHDRASGEALLKSGGADAIAYGRWYISNPDLVERFRKNAELNPYHRETFYGEGPVGYTDYPFLEA